MTTSPTTQLNHPDAGSHDPQHAATSGKALRSALPRLTFKGIVASEWIKLSSLRSIRITVVITVLVGLMMSVMVASLTASQQSLVYSPEDLRVYLLTPGFLTVTFIALVFGVLGVFTISSEYSSGMILSTLAAAPRRTSVMLAKSLILALIAGVTALLVVFSGLLISIMFYPDAAAEIGSVKVISGTLGAVAYLVLIALFAFGVAGILRSTAGGISVIAGVFFVLPIVFQLIGFQGAEWALRVYAYLPSTLGGVLTQGISDVTQQQGMMGDYAASYPVALGAIALWAVAAVIPAIVLFNRRDAK
jgi:ABC-2 type transport system permease protein